MVSVGFSERRNLDREIVRDQEKQANGDANSLLLYKFTQKQIKMLSRARLTFEEVVLFMNCRDRFSCYEM